ncbi:glycoside hydrolase family 24 protein [Pleurocapsa sp. FMAR1]|uniref:glycoside hydrolase family 24 protein n=1 Tax=Pleurocapsa sp. FMAR1 TaxID=3040204 RepID=UPI0029C83FFC|nr:glycoside hydrolase family protein [Pleurocapsa sp. FMAR1]
MQLSNKAKFLYLGCLILILLKLRLDISKSQVDAHWQTPKQLFSQLFQDWRDKNSHQAPYAYSTNLYSTQPLMMAGGDPYIRALMRTITASEANVKRPYNVIYGGQYVDDLSHHPEVCVPIVAGPNVGQCSTAAGRYQMLDFTWSKQAQLYHPRPSGIWRWKTYSFEAEYQDAVVYEWLSDSNAWGTDIPQLLRQGKITQVLKLLSGTWTSLGYGIETNSMSDYLPKIYQNMLQEELS